MEDPKVLIAQMQASQAAVEEICVYMLATFMRGNPDPKRAMTVFAAQLRDQMSGVAEMHAEQMPDAQNEIRDAMALVTNRLLARTEKTLFGPFEPPSGNGQRGN